MSETDSLLEVYIYENLQLLEQLDALILAAERSGALNGDQVSSIFRILHTIKGSSAMMNFDGLTRLSHALEDLFGYIRDHIDSPTYDHKQICDLVFSAADFIRNEIESLQAGKQLQADPKELLHEISVCYKGLKGDDAAAQTPVSPSPPPAASNASDKGSFYRGVIRFEPECKMENVRAFGIVKSVEPLCHRIATTPEDLLKDHTDDEIIAHGFYIYMQSEAPAAELRAKIADNFFISTLQFEELDSIAGTPLDQRTQEASSDTGTQAVAPTQVHNYMSVRLDKLDKLMDLVGEIVTTEMTVVKNPDLAGLQLESFSKAAHQLRKLTDELQDTVMSIRMIPISATFHKLERVVRNMCKKTGKLVELVIIGEDTEMDKNVIDNLSDPLMHIIRNSVDHGIEEPEIRKQTGKNPTGKIILEARNIGGDVLILVSDDGKGLNRDVLLQRGIDKGLVKKAADEISDKEVFGLIFAPGFSTNDAVTEFSGRGVGMDVVAKNIQQMGGSVMVDSEPGQGMTVQLRIPLTLAIIEGMQISVNHTIFILPLLNIRESFKPKPKDVFADPDGNEMILIRKQCYPVCRLHRVLGIEPAASKFEDGILVLIESAKGSYCLFVDELIGEQQTVVKPIPAYIARYPEWHRGIAGCSVMGDGSVSLILDINALTE
ncbi:MAG: chemotaxis protein CheW [Christensenellales bacterium]|jgi:two-component system chemotaxis sensor kinase CheA